MPESNFQTHSGGYFGSLQGGGRRLRGAALNGDNAADGKIGGAESLVTGRMEH